MVEDRGERGSRPEGTAEIDCVQPPLRDLFLTNTINGHGLSPFAKDDLRFVQITVASTVRIPASLRYGSGVVLQDATVCGFARRLGVACICGGGATAGRRCQSEGGARQASRLFG